MSCFLTALPFLLGLGNLGKHIRLFYHQDHRHRVGSGRVRLVHGGFVVAMLSTAERLKSTVFQRNIKNVYAIKCLVVDGDCRAGDEGEA